MDNYPNQTITITGTPENEDTNATAYSITGFENQDITQATEIAADGSTVVNVYYDRLFYNVTYSDGKGNTINFSNATLNATGSAVGLIGFAEEVTMLPKK